MPFPVLMWRQPPSAVWPGEARLQVGAQEDAAGVAQPDAIRGPVVKSDIVRESVGALEHSARLPRCGRVVDDQFDALMLRQIANDFGVDPRNRLEFSRPVAVKVRPSQPRGGVRFPLGGHAVAEGMNCGWLL